MSCHDRPPVTPTRQAISTTARDVERAYAARGLDVEVADEVVGPRTVTLTLMPRRGATVRATCGLVVDVQVALGVPSASARVVDGRLILELGRRDPEFPTLRSVLGRPRARGKFAIGIDVRGEVVDLLLGDCPHVCVSGSSGCLHADTPIHDPTDKTTKTVQERWMAGTGFHVWARDFDGNPVVAAALPPTKFKPAQMMRVTLSNGETFTVTTGHRFLTTRGWMTASEVYEQLQRCGHVLLPSSSDTDLQARAETVVQVENVELLDVVEPYFDFHVPAFNNYWAGGVWHHNSGKTEALHAIIGGLVATHDTNDLGLALVDLKGTKLTRWAWLPHLVEDVVVDADVAHDLFCRVLDTVEGRYRQDDAPPLVVVVDEFADLVAQADVLPVVTRIAAKAREANVHLIVATQRPDVKVLPGDLKANLPVRLALRTATQVDSRVVIDRAGAEKLLGKGDALLMDAGGIRRLQVPMVTPDEHEWLKQHYTTGATP